MENEIVRIYKPEELETMNYILGKEKGNKIFTKFELETMNMINLYDEKVVNVSKIIWDNRNDTKKLNSFKEQLDKELKIKKGR